MTISTETARAQGSKLPKEIVGLIADSYFSESPEPEIPNQNLWTIWDLLDETDKYVKKTRIEIAPSLLGFAYIDLESVNRDHELLKYGTVENGNFIVADEFSEEFYKRFPPIDPDSNDGHEVYSLLSYHDELLEALKK